MHRLAVLLLPISVICFLCMLPAREARGSDVSYKCKGADGKWAAENCTGALEPKPSEAAIRAKEAEDAPAKDDARRTGWSKLCASNVGGHCVNDHASDYAEMERVMKSAAGADRAKAEACFLRWFSETADVVDAKMWRYCYYRP